ncbi:MAG TPA: hydroxyacid dehydrogenase [Elusimicrobiota bacterium]|nr:hydroxyacid dehydrogenase [Elusimicrobiota bacterium]
MKTAFFEITPSEKETLKARKDLGEPLFFSEEMHKVSPVKFRDAEIVSVFVYSQLTAEVLKKCPRLKFVSTRSTGYDHVDLEYCRKKKIVVSNVPHYGENTVAEHTFALILGLSRRTRQAYIKALRSDYSLDGLQGFDLQGKTLGVIGTGRIGLRVVRIAGGFGMNVLAYDAFPNSLIAETLNFKYVPLERLLSDSDIVTLHAPYTPQTHHLIHRENIGLMKKGAILINTARGALVDTEALTLALDKGWLSGAGLDVLEGEDLVKEERQILSHQYSNEKLRTLLQTHILRNRDNVIITPHVAFNSRESFMRILQTTMTNILAFRAGRPENTVGLPPAKR